MPAPALLTPEQELREIAHLRLNAAEVMRYRDDDARRWFLAMLEKQERRATAPVVFRLVSSLASGDEFELGDDSDQAHPYVTNIVGLRAAWTVLRQRRPVEAAGFARPGARNPDDIVRRSIRRDAVDFAMQKSPRLVPVLLAMTVVEGRVVFEPSPSLPSVLT